MIERFFDIQKNLVESVSLDFQRYLVKEIDFNERLVGIVGARGTGFEYEIVAVREIFFVNQVKHKNVIFGSTRADFTVNEKYIFEVGGKSKKAKQVDLSKEEFLVKDDVLKGFAWHLFFFLCIILFAMGGSGTEPNGLKLVLYRNRL